MQEQKSKEGSGWKIQTTQMASCVQNNSLVPCFRWFYKRFTKDVISLVQIWVIESTPIDVKTSNHNIINTLNPILFWPVMRKTKFYQSIGRPISVNVIKLHCPIGRVF